VVADERAILARAPMPDSPLGFSDDSRVVVAADQVSRTLTGGAAIVNLNSGVYYGLDEVGTRIWDLIHQPITVRQIREAIVRDYDVDPSAAAADIHAFLIQLAGQGLIEIRE
jgi:Coenzyme PQQ synthesis protein D (PqqD)